LSYIKNDRKFADKLASSVKHAACGGAVNGISTAVRTANLGSYSMPTDAIVALVMATAFGTFAATLFWVDLQTRGLS